MAGAGGSDAQGGASNAGAFSAGASGANTSAGASGVGTDFCGAALSAEEPLSPPPTLVFSRVQLFIEGATSGTPLDISGQTSNEMAGNYALQLLDEHVNDAAPGLSRFVSSWLQDTPAPEVWAAYFSRPDATFSDLLTTSDQLAHGSGVLTDLSVLQPDLISARGQFISKILLCNAPNSPPNTPPLAERKPNQTRREVFETDTALRNPACQACHKRLDPIGFSLQHFASTGDFRNTEFGLPLDTSGSIQIDDGNTLVFANVNELGAGLASSCAALQCVTRQLLADALHSANPTHDIVGDDVERIAQKFSASGYQLRELVRAIVQSKSFLSQ
jgi:hypothetical protein